MKLGKTIFKKILKKGRDLYINIMYSWFNVIPKKTKTTKGLRIIVYHGICEKDPHKFNSRFITKQQFESELILIKKLYNPISFEDLAGNRLSSEKLNVLVTFDDGLKNNYQLALPLLKEHHIPAIFFVTGCNTLKKPYLFNDLTDIIPFDGSSKITIEDEVFERKKIFLHYRYVSEKGILLAKKYHNSSYHKRHQIVEYLLETISRDVFKEHKLYYELMSDDDIKEIAQEALFKLGMHGFYHTDLSCLDELEVNAEIEKSIHYLSSVTNQKMDTIAFPYGNCNANLINVCERNDVKHMFLTENALESNQTGKLYVRHTINPFVSPILQMYYLAKNNYE